MLIYPAHQQMHIFKYAQSHMIILHLHRVLKDNNMGLNMPQNVNFVGSPFKCRKSHQNFKFLYPLIHVRSRLP